jgi:hypothetical protein
LRWRFLNQGYLLVDLEDSIRVGGWRRGRLLDGRRRRRWPRRGRGLVRCGAAAGRGCGSGGRRSSGRRSFLFFLLPASRRVRGRSHKSGKHVQGGSQGRSSGLGAQDGWQGVGGTAASASGNEITERLLQVLRSVLKGFQRFAQGARHGFVNVARPSTHGQAGRDACISALFRGSKKIVNSDKAGA